MIYKNAEPYFPHPDIKVLGECPPKGYILVPKSKPPRACALERSVIGAVLFENEIFYQTELYALKEIDFYSELHRDIWKVLSSLLSEEEGSRVDFRNLAATLNQYPKYYDKGIEGYLLNLTLFMRAPKSLLEKYRRHIQSVSSIRQICTTALEMAGKLLRSNKEDRNKDAAQLRDESYEILRSTYEQTAHSQDLHIYRDLSPLKGSFSEFLQSQSDQGGELVSTPFAALNELLGGGLKGGNYYIVAARPSMGKTTLALNLADHLLKSKKSKNHVLFISMEMKTEDLFKKSFVAETQTELEDLVSTEEEDPEYSFREAKFLEIRSRPLHILNPHSFAIEDLVTAARRAQKVSNGNLGLMIIDYIQLMSSAKSPGSKMSANRNQEISDISRAMKGLALELNIPVVTLSQLNRNLEERLSRRPILSDLRDSGSLEQDADVVAFLYRKEMYSRRNEDKGHAELILAKNRMGAIGSVDLHFNGKLSTFSTYFSTDVDDVENVLFEDEESDEESNAEIFNPEKVKKTFPLGYTEKTRWQKKKKAKKKTAK